MATKGTKTQKEQNVQKRPTHAGFVRYKKIGFVTFVLFVVNPHFSPSRTRY